MQGSSVTSAIETKLTILFQKARYFKLLISLLNGSWCPSHPYGVLYMDYPGVAKRVYLFHNRVLKMFEPQFTQPYRVYRNADCRSVHHVQLIYYMEMWSIELNSGIDLRP